MGIQLIEAARLEGVEKCVILGTVCAYPKFTPVPVPRGGPLERLPGGDECALRAGEEDAAGPVPGLPAAVRVQLDIPVAGEPLRARGQVRPRRFPRHSGADHQVPDRREERRKTVEVWGTGKASREFLYVEDAARAIVLATEKYNKSDPVNIGAGGDQHQRAD